MDNHFGVIQGHLPLRGDSIGLQVAMIPRERRDEVGMVDGAHRPLLLILWDVWPWKQQDVREGSAHQHLSLVNKLLGRGIRDSVEYFLYCGDAEQKGRTVAARETSEWRADSSSLSRTLVLTRAVTVSMVVETSVTNGCVFCR